MDCLDSASLNLILRLQLEDLEALQATVNKQSKNRDGEKPDFVAALDAYQDDLAGASQVLADRAMSQSIARAVRVDAETLRSLRAEEDQAARDRALALRLAGKANPDGVGNEVDTKTPALSEEMLTRLDGLWIGDADDMEYGAGSGHAGGASAPCSWPR